MESHGVARRSRRVWIWSALGVLIAAGIVVGLLAARSAGGSGGKKKSGKDGPPASPVELTAVSRGTIDTWLETTTALEAQNSAVLVARGQGEVVQVVAEEGAWVEKGALLARLDDTNARLALQRAELSAQAAAHDAERGAQLIKQGYLSTKDNDDLEMKRKSAEVDMEQRRHDLADMRVVAPFAGRVTDRSIHLGETVVPGKECFRLVDTEPMLARVYFPERELTRVRVGETASLEVDAAPGRPFQARVSLVNPVVDRANGTFKVTLEVRDPGHVLRPGSFARARIRTGQFADAVLLPRRATLNEDGEDFVFVAHGDTVARVPIRIGAVSGDVAQILAGVTAGDSVVSVGQGGLKQGSRIKPIHL
ncbi:MAG: efflux RND transporter periplasmic adaptor subunit [Candidatus Eisenbacteria bacterium]|nr:efflux RND transporter periplasmic adaptor subunit [Candidatus Eisenbacteria bacterium]